MVDLKALEAITGTEWRVDATGYENIAEGYVDSSGLWLSREHGKDTWDAFDTKGPDGVIEQTDPDEAVREVFGMRARRRSARPNLRRQSVECCLTCKMSTLGVEGDLSCTDNNSAHDADYLNICDHYARRT